MSQLPDRELKTVKEFYDFFHAIPEKEWTKAVLFDEESGCKCANGHLGLTKSYIPPKDGFIEQNLINLANIFRPRLVRDEYERDGDYIDDCVSAIYRVNDMDGSRGKSAKQNILSELEKHL